MKKILLVANVGFTLSNFRSELIEKFKDHGFIVKVVCPKDSDFNNQLELLDVEIIPISLSRKGINPLHDFSTFLQLYQIFKKEKPDLVLNYTIKPVIYSSIAASFAGVKKVASFITGLGFIFTNQSYKVRLLRFFVSLLYRFSLSFNRRIFFQNKDDLNLFLENKIIKKRKSFIINGSGVNLEKFKIPKGIKKIPKSFVLVGRLLKDKGITEFVKAARVIKKRYPESSFWLCGSPDENPASFTIQDAKKWEREGFLNYTPFTNDIKSFLEDKEVFVLPSYREGTPRSVLEAMSMKMPIITTDAPGCRETTIHGLNGLLVEVGQYKPLVEAMEQFILIPDLKKSMGNKSFQIVQEKYDVHKVNDCIFKGLDL